MYAIEQEISDGAQMLPIVEIGRRLGLADDLLEPFGHYMAKIDPWHPEMPVAETQGKVILVTAINPTPAGEGKTVTSIGLNDALCQLGKRSVLCLREPSLGPYFGNKGGATGSGQAQIAPSQRINTHFTGDFHAITSAHNLLAALIDNVLFRDNSIGLDPESVTWSRVLDMNDRALRHIVTGLGGKANGVTRETGFEITAASEIMAIVALSENVDDLKARLSNMVIGRHRTENRFIYAYELGCINAMVLLLKEALKPNLVQSLEHNPVLMHAGPFANIAHGCNSVVATKTAMNLGDYVVTEAGFGSGLGAEKFFNIKCRQSAIKPSAVVCVVTVRSLKMHGGVPKNALSAPNLDAVKEGLSNLGRHLENITQFGLPSVVAINHMFGDSEAEINAIEEYCRLRSVHAVLAKHWAEGGQGAQLLAQTVIDVIDNQPNFFKPLYADDMALMDKMQTIATKVYQAKDVEFSAKAKKQIKEIEAAGWGHLPVCMAKTQYSFSADPSVLGAPVGHTLPIREIKLSSGAGFVVALCGDMMTMPGLSKHPSALDM
ncbi:MAG: formate--tetrahydrofolate ligase [Francisellaceae bacterium]